MPYASSLKRNILERRLESIAQDRYMQLRSSNNNYMKLTILFFLSLFMISQVSGQDTLYIGVNSDDWSKLCVNQWWDSKSDSIQPLTIDPKSNFRLNRVLSHTFYNKSDSSLFNGIIITQYQPRTTSMDGDYWLNVIEFTDGKMNSFTEFAYIQGETNSKVDSVIFRELEIQNPIYSNSLLQNEQTKYIGRLSGVFRHQRFHYEFYPNGNVKLRENYRINTWLKKEWSRLTYTQEGQIASEMKTKWLDSITYLNQNIHYFSGTRKRNYHNEERVNESTGQTIRFDLELNETGDTVSYYHKINNKFEGIRISNFTWADETYSIRTIWSQNIIIDVINEGILYIDGKGKITDEKNYLLSNSMKESHAFLQLQSFDNPVIIEGKKYTLFTSLMPEGPKLWKKLNKLMKAYNIN